MYRASVGDYHPDEEPATLPLRQRFKAGGWSAIRDGQDGRARLCRADRDWLRRKDMSAGNKALAERLLDEADRGRRFNDYLLRHGRLWPKGRHTAVAH